MEDRQTHRAAAHARTTLSENTVVTGTKPSPWQPPSQEFKSRNTQRKDKVLVTIFASALFVIRKKTSKISPISG